MAVEGQLDAYEYMESPLDLTGVEQAAASYVQLRRFTQAELDVEKEMRELLDRILQKVLARSALVHIEAAYAYGTDANGEVVGTPEVITDASLFTVVQRGTRDMPYVENCLDPLSSFKEGGIGLVTDPLEHDDVPPKLWELHGWSPDSFSRVLVPFPGNIIIVRPVQTLQAA